MIIYKTVNTVNGKIYVGQDSNNNQKYFGSGIRLKRAIQKYGEENFIKITLCECNTKVELDEMEEHWINLLNATHKDVGYNISKGGNRFRSNDGTTNQKISNTLSGRKQSPETIEKRAKKLRGMKKPQSFSDAMSKVHKGKVLSQETRNKISKSTSEAIKEKWKDPKYRDKQLKSRCGKSNPFYGKSHSKESKEKMRQAKLGKKRNI